MAIYLGLFKGRPSYLGSLQASKENIQHFRHGNYYSIFVGNFCPPGSGSKGTQINADPGPKP